MGDFSLIYPVIQCTEMKEEENPPTSGKDYAGEVESFRSLCGDHDAEALKVLLEKISSRAKCDIAPIVLSPDSDKSHRAVSVRSLILEFMFVFLFEIFKIVIFKQF